MKISDYLRPQKIVCLDGNQKSGAVDRLIRVVSDNIGHVTHEELKAAVQSREEVMSTGIGNGLAIPHVRLPSIHRPVIAIGISHEGITDYETVDDEPVRIIVMIIVPQDDKGTHIKLLASAASVLKNEDVRKRILKAADTDEVYEILVAESSS